MKKITIKAEFLMWGHGSFNVIPSSFVQWNAIVSSSQDYNLDTGKTYTIVYDTVTGGGGTVTILDGANVIASDNITAGMYSGHLRITI